MSNERGSGGARTGGGAGSGARGGKASQDTPFPRNIGAPATRALVAAGYTELRQLAGVPASELERLHGMGPTALGRLQQALQAQGLSLG